MVRFALRLCCLTSTPVMCHWGRHIPCWPWRFDLSSSPGLRLNSNSSEKGFQPLGSLSFANLQPWQPVPPLAPGGGPQMAPGCPTASHWGTERKVTHTGTSPACKMLVAYPSSLVFLLELPNQVHRWGNRLREVKTFASVRAGLCHIEGGLWALDVFAPGILPPTHCLQGWVRGVCMKASPLISLGQFLLGDNEEVGRDGSGFSHPTHQIHPFNFKDSSPLSTLCICLWLGK